jgi:hypothetical protein
MGRGSALIRQGCYAGRDATALVTTARANDAGTTSTGSW